MATDVRKHTAPAGGETPRRQAFNDLSLSINDFIPVANTTERTQLVADLTSAGKGPTASRPLVVYRQDAFTGQQFEVTRDGTAWAVLQMLEGGSLPHLVVRRAALVQSRPGGAWGVVLFDTQGDTTGHQPWTWSPGNPVTLTEGGLYAIEAAISMSIATFGLQVVAGGRVKAQTPLGTSGTLVANATSTIVRLAAGDTIAVNVYPSATANVLTDSTTGPSYLSVTRLSG